MHFLWWEWRWIWTAQPHNPIEKNKTYFTLTSLGSFIFSLVRVADAILLSFCCRECRNLLYSTTLATGGIDSVLTWAGPSVDKKTKIQSFIHKQHCRLLRPHCFQHRTLWQNQTLDRNRHLCFVAQADDSNVINVLTRIKSKLLSMAYLRASPLVIICAVRLILISGLKSARCTFCSALWICCTLYSILQRYDHNF